MLTSESVEMLAHQGGWDEVLLLAGPVLVIVALGALARRRMRGESDPDPDDVDLSDGVDPTMV